MGRADFKEIILINRLDEAGWLSVPSTGQVSRTVMVVVMQLRWSGRDYDIRLSKHLWFWGRLGCSIKYWLVRSRQGESQEVGENSRIRALGTVIIQIVIDAKRDGSREKTVSREKRSGGHRNKGDKWHTGLCPLSSTMTHMIVTKTLNKHNFYGIYNLNPPLEIWRC